MASAEKIPTLLHAIDTTGPGGAETVFLDMAEHLKVPGCRTLALIKGPGWVEQQLIQRNIPYVILKPHGFASIPYYLKVWKLLRQHRVKAVYAHLLGSALTFALLRRFSGCKPIAILHGQVDVNPNERFMSIKRSLLKWNLAKVVAVSDELGHYLAKRRLFSQQQIQVIYNGIDVERYHQSADTSATNLTSSLKTQLALPNTTQLVGCLGNIRPAKDYPTLIRAAAVLKDGYPNLHWVVAGHQKEPLMSELNQLCESERVTERVHFVGFTDDTVAFLRQLDVFALSSSSEGFSIATLEAMATGIPIVVTRSGGPEAIVTHNVDGLMVPTADPEAMASAIEHCLNEPEQTTKRINLAKKAVAEQFSLNTMLERYKDLALPLLGCASAGNSSKRKSEAAV